jgi:hypothetical protein
LQAPRLGVAGDRQLGVRVLTSGAQADPAGLDGRRPHPTPGPDERWLLRSPISEGVSGQAIATGAMVVVEGERA